MNIFEFIERIIVLASSSFSNFFISLIFISLIGILAISFVSAIFSDFRLFEINRNKNERVDKGSKMGINLKKENNNNDIGISIYDLLVKAWEKRKKNNN